MCARAISLGEFYAMMIVSVAASDPERHWHEIELADRSGLTAEEFLTGMQWAAEHSMFTRDENRQNFYVQ
jgi:hypothetical protein